jgi:hypothetical protein
VLGVFDHSEGRTMGDVIDVHGLDPKIAAARVGICFAGWTV